MGFGKQRLHVGVAKRLLLAAFVIFSLTLTGLADAADTIEGQVLGAGAPIAKSTVTLWSASAEAPKQLAQAQTNDEGRFTLSFEVPSGASGVLYIIAKGGEPKAQKAAGDNSAIALLSVIGNAPLSHVTINEFCAPQKLST